MKSLEKQKAIELRKSGLSIRKIFKILSVSKSSVSFWVRGVQLTQAQKKQLSENGVKKEIIELRRITRLNNENKRRQYIIDEAKKQIPKLSDKDLWLIGSLLYWAEGRKKTVNTVTFSNSDPEMIKFMMTFFRKVCNVPENKFRGHIHIHPHLDHKKAEAYWSDLTQIPPNQFFKTYRKMNKASKHKRDSLPLGTLDVYICSGELFLKIKGWVEGIFNSY